MPRFAGVPVESQSAGPRFGGVPVEPSARPAIPNAPLGEVGPITEVSRQAPDLMGRLSEIGGRLAESFTQGAVGSLQGALQTGGEVIDQTIQRANPLPLWLEAAGANVPEGVRDPLGAAALAEEAAAVGDLLAQDRAATLEATGGRPESIMAALGDPLQAADYYGNIGAQSAAPVLLAAATRNPRLAAAAVGVPTGGQIFSEARREGQEFLPALGEGVAAFGLETALGVSPFELAGTAGRRLLSIPSEGVAEGLTEVAQANVSDLARGTETPVGDQLVQALDAAIVGSGLQAAPVGAGVLRDLARADRRPSNAIPPPLGDPEPSIEPERDPGTVAPEADADIEQMLVKNILGADVADELGIEPEANVSDARDRIRAIFGEGETPAPVLDAARLPPTIDADRIASMLGAPESAPAAPPPAQANNQVRSSQPAQTHQMPDGTMMAGPEHPGAVPGTTRPADQTPEQSGQVPAWESAPLPAGADLGKLYRRGSGRSKSSAEALQLPDGTWLVRSRKAGRWQDWHKPTDVDGNEKDTFDASPTFGYKPVSVRSVRIPGVGMVPVNPEDTGPERREREYNPLRDLVVGAGGIRRSDAKFMGADPATFNDRLGVRPLYSDNGASLNDLREMMIEEGYFAQEDPDSPPEISDEDVWNLVSDALSGEPVAPLGDPRMDEIRRQRYEEQFGPDAGPEIDRDEEMARWYDDVEAESGEAIAPSDEAEALSVFDLSIRAMQAGVDVEPELGESDADFARRAWAAINEATNADRQPEGRDYQAGAQVREGRPAQPVSELQLETQPAVTEAPQEVAPSPDDFALEPQARSQEVEDDAARRTLSAQQTGLFGASETRRAADEQRASQARSAPAPSVGGGLFGGNRPQRQPTSGEGLESVEAPFYSALSQAVAEAKGAPRRANAEAWKQWLDGGQRRGEFKKSERDWLGVDAWLSGRDSTTREELAEFIRANEVQVQEVILGNGLDSNLPAGWTVERNEDDDGFEVLDAQGIMRGEGATEAEAMDDAQDRDARGEAGAPKFASYQLPGGQNYRELLLTLPTPKADRDAKAEAVNERIIEQQDRLAPEFGALDNWPENERAQRAEMEREYYAIVDQPETLDDRGYRSSHFDQPNILAHVRFNERTDADGKRVLFIEEIQSDWHQRGRKGGYSPRDPDAEIRRLQDESDAFYAGKDTSTDAGLSAAIRSLTPEQRRREQEIQDRITEINVARGAGVPDAPFKATDEWAMLAFKRMVRHAAENGFDRIAWTTGAQQADRYDLSKQVRSVDYVDGQRLIVRDLTGAVIYNEPTAREKIADVIGKDPAERLLATAPRREDGFNMQRISGNGLKVGGEGMRAFYDKILPSSVNKWAKKFGGRVGQARVQPFTDKYHSENVAALREMDALPEGGVPNEPMDVHAIDLTPAMRDAALVGQPLFNTESQSRQDGEDTADLFGLREAVNAALGPVAAKVKYLDGIAGLPVRLRNSVERKLEQRGGRGRTAALYDPRTKDVYLFTDVVTTPERAVWNVAHEIAGHEGLRTLLGDRLNNALEIALQNPTVAKLADVIAKQRNLRGDQRLLATEEALAELAAAVRTDNYAEIQSRYDVQVPEGIRANVKRAIDNFLRRLKALLNRITGQTFTDEDVRALLENAWQAAQGGATVSILRPDGTTVSEQVVFHGTPHTVDRFSLQKIGTGEGAQAYGWGLYFASRREVADSYRRTLSAPSVDPANLRAAPTGSTADKLVRKFAQFRVLDESDLNDAGISPDNVHLDGNGEISTSEFIESGYAADSSADVDGGGYLFGFEDGSAIYERDGESKAVMPKQGSLYRVDVPEDSDLLDWDKPLNKQPEKVRAALRNAYLHTPSAAGGYNAFNVPDSFTGRQLYMMLQASAKSPKAASEALMAAGIPGLRYLDGSSRNKGGGSHNYVIWDESAIGEPGSALESAAPDQTQTPAFRRWFGDSKVVDASGRPLIVYRGGKPQSRFKDGAFFAYDRSVAEDYVERDGDTVGEFHLSLQNPLVLSTGEQVREAWEAAGVIGQGRRFHGSDDSMQAGLRRWAIEQGHDGIMVEPSAFDGDVGYEWAGGTFGEPQIIAFRGDQVRRVESDSILESVEESPTARRARENITRREEIAKQRRENAADTLGVETGERGPWDFPKELWRTPEGVRGRFRTGGKQGVGVNRHVRAEYQDKMIAFRDVQRAIEKASGKQLADLQNVYQMENLMHGRVMEGFKRYEEKRLEPLAKAMHKAGLDMSTGGKLAKLAGAPELTELEAYLWARHAKERNAVIAEKNPKMPDGGSGMSNTTADKVLAAADTAKLEPLAKMVDRITRETRTRLLEHGIITQAQHDAMEAQYDNFVPLRGQNLEADQEFTNARVGAGGVGLDGRGKVVREAMGRGEGNPPSSILGEVIRDAQASIIQAEKARVGRSLMRLVLANPSPMWAVEPVNTERVVDANGEVYERAANDAADPSVVYVRHKGELYKVQLNAPLAKAFAHVGVDQMTQLTRIAGKVNRYFSAIYTKYNPYFLARNGVRDMIFGMTGLVAEHGELTALKAAKAYPAAARAAYRFARGKPPKGKLGQRYAEYIEDGGKTGWVSSRSAEDLARGLGGGIAGYNPQGVKKAARVVGDFIGDANDAVESALRFAAYTTLRDKGVSRQQSAFYSKDLTVNFNRKGFSGSSINAWLIFFNPAMQGSKRFIDLAKNPKAMGYMMGLASIQALAMMAAMGEEDEEGEPIANLIPEYLWKRNLVIVVNPEEARRAIAAGEIEGDNLAGVITIPMPYGVNVLTYGAGRIVRGFMGEEARPEDTAAGVTSDILSAAVQGISPVPIGEGASGLIHPLLGIFADIHANKNYFGSAIHNKYADKAVPLAQQGRPDTLEIYKTAARLLNRAGGGDEVTPSSFSWFNVAPEDVEYVTNELMGGPIRFVSDLATMTGKAFDPNADMDPRDMPVLNSFYTNVDREAAQQSLYYNRKDAIERSAARVNLTFKRDGFEAAQTLLEDTPELQGAVIKRLNATSGPEDAVRAAGERGGLSAARAELRKHPELAGVHARLRGGKVSLFGLGDAEDRGRGKGPPRLSSAGNLQFGTSSEDSVYALFKAAQKAVTERNSAVRAIYADNPATLGSLLTGAGRKREAAIREADRERADKQQAFNDAYVRQVVGAAE